MGTLCKSAPDRINYKVWQDGYHPVHLATNEMIDQRLDYIHNNPVKAGLVYKPDNYVFSSASAYAGGECFLPIQFVG